MTVKYKLFIFSFLLVLSLTWNLSNSLAAIEPGAAGATKPKVAVNDIKSQKFETKIIYPVKIESKVNASILAEADGVITQLPQVGDKLAAKQSIIKIQQQDPVYNFAPFVLKSPVAGYVSEILVTLGSQVSRGQKLMTITDPYQLRLVAEITAADLNIFKPGLTGDLNVPNSSEEMKSVKIAGISPLVNPSTGTSTCVLEFANEKNPTSAKKMTQLSPGSVAQVEFKIPSREGIYIPKTAILFKGSTAYVRILENGQAKHQTVKLGEEKEDVVLVLEGLKVSQKLILRSSSFLTDGQSVITE